VNSIAFIVVGLTLIPNFPLLVICRLIQGICAGLYTSIVPVTVKETVPYEVSGTFGAFLQLFTGVGAIISILIQKILTDTTGDQSLYWRISFGFPLVTIIVQSIVLIFAYNFETPKYLLLNDR
jgi:MFS family permease